MPERLLVDGNSDLLSVCGFEHCSNEQGWANIVKIVARAAREDFLNHRSFYYDRDGDKITSLWLSCAWPEVFFRSPTLTELSVRAQPVQEP
ncbi:hypothetical protein [Rhizobium sp. RCC_161_2]|uniref:hypothetical protein n=1 Tax=Rhizobium sp. RCC_161_2 TaxID=3239219 RepID=UPI0035243340